MPAPAPRPGPSDHVRGVLGLVSATLIWGSTYVVIKGALDDIGPLSLALARFALVTPLMVPLARRAGLSAGHLRQPRLWVFGATGVTCYFGLQNLGIAFTTAGSAALITAAIPALTAALAWRWLGERPSPRRCAGLALSSLGVGLVVGSGLALADWRAVAGNLLVLGSAAAWAAYTVQGRRLSTSVPPLVATTAGFATGSVLLVPLAAVEVAATGWPAVTATTVAAVAFLGLFGSGVAIVAWNTGVRAVEASLAGAFANVVPVIGLLIALATGEPVSALQVLGGLVAVAGVGLAHDVRSRPRPAPAGTVIEPAPTALAVAGDRRGSRQGPGVSPGRGA